MTTQIYKCIFVSGKSLVAQFKNNHGTNTKMGSGSSGIDKEMKKGTF